MRPDSFVTISVIADLLQDIAGRHAEDMNLSGFRLRDDVVASVELQLP